MPKNPSVHADIPSLELAGDGAIPVVGFGTYLVSNDDAEALVKLALREGYRHIDTAEAYGNEAGVGSAIASAIESKTVARDELFVTTKLWPGNAAWGDTPKDAQATIASLDESLERLRLDYVDLYLIHAPFTSEQRLDQWRGMVELCEQGKARAIGVSNFSQAHIEELRAADLPLPAVNQIELHPWSQKPELVSYLAGNGIATIAYSSLVPLSTWRAEEGQNSAKTDEMRSDGDAADSPFKAMAEKYGVTESQVLLRWGVQKGYAVIPKSSNADRIRQNIDLFSFVIDDADMDAIANMDRGEGVAWATGDPMRAA